MRARWIEMEKNNKTEMEMREIVTPEAHADDTTVPFHLLPTLRVRARVCRAHFRAAHVRIRTLIRIADTCFVFIVRQNVSGQTMGRVEQRRYLLERAERDGHGETRRILSGSF